MHQVKAVFILVAIVNVLLAVSFVLLRSRPTARRRLGLAVLALYMVATFRYTLFFRRAGATGLANLQLLWSYRKSLSLVDGALRIDNYSLLVEIALNYLLYVPLGCLLPFTWPEHFRDKGVPIGLSCVTLVACTCSAVTELAQFVLRIGLCELDDVLGNTLGAVLGYLLFYGVTLVLERALRSALRSGRHYA